MQVLTDTEKNGKTDKKNFNKINNVMRNKRAEKNGKKMSEKITKKLNRIKKVFSNKLAKFLETREREFQYTEKA